MRNILVDPVWLVSFRYARKIGQNAEIQKGYCHSQNLSNDGRIRAEFRDQTLRISLPLRHISEQQKQEAIRQNAKGIGRREKNRSRG